MHISDSTSCLTPWLLAERPELWTLLPTIEGIMNMCLLHVNLCGKLSSRAYDDLSASGLIKRAAGHTFVNCDAERHNKLIVASDNALVHTATAPSNSSIRTSREIQVHGLLTW